MHINRKILPHALAALLLLTALFLSPGTLAKEKHEHDSNGHFGTCSVCNIVAGGKVVAKEIASAAAFVLSVLALIFALLSTKKYFSMRYFNFSQIALRVRLNL